MSVETIKNYFRKAEFYESDMVDPVEDFGNEWQEFHELVGSDSVTFEDFVAIDDNLANTGVQSVEELTEERNLTEWLWKWKWQWHGRWSCTLI